jgi:hypothetical protein
LAACDILAAAGQMHGGLALSQFGPERRVFGPVIADTHQRPPGWRFGSRLNKTRLAD